MNLRKKVNILQSLIYYQFFFMVVLFGFLLNLTALSLNNGKMPVYSELQWETGTHFSFADKSEVNRWILTDFMKLKGFGYEMWFSIGDVFIIIGVTSILFISLASVISLLWRKREYLSSS